MIEEVKKIPLNDQGARIMEGQAVKTEGYNERYPKFIHTVAPYYDFDNNEPKPKVMAQCFDSIFTIVKKDGIKSISIPPIGTGFYGFPYLLYCEISFDRVLHHLVSNPDLTQVTFLTNEPFLSEFFLSFYSQLL